MNRTSINAMADLARFEQPFPDLQFPPSLYYRFLRILARELKPAVSVELGVCGGGGCLYLADGHRDGLVYGVDIVNDYPMQLAYIKHHYANYHLILGDSVEVGKTWQHGPVDILFIDTTHTYDQTLAEYGAWSTHLRANAIIVLDDLNRDGMADAFYAIPGVEHILLNVLHDGAGFGVILT